MGKAKKVKKKRKEVQLPSDTELLEELATLDEVSAVIPTHFDHDAGAVPPWCELLLEVKRLAGGDAGPGSWPIHQRWYLRRHDGELLIEVLHDVLHPTRSNAYVAIWSELDNVVDKIQARIDRGKDPLKADVGQALGLATALAWLDNVVEPDVDDVRAQAMERYDARNGISGVGEGD